MEKDHSLKNALNDKTSAEEKSRVERKENEANSTKEIGPPKEDIVDKLLRGFVAFFTAVFISALIAGMLEIAQGWKISFGSPPMIFSTALLYYPSYKVLTWLGFFRQK